MSSKLLSTDSLHEGPLKHLCWLCYIAVATALGVCGTALSMPRCSSAPVCHKRLQLCAVLRSPSLCQQAAREAGRRARDQMHHRLGGRAMEAMMEEAIEQAYIEEGLDVSSACVYL